MAKAFRAKEKGFVNGALADVGFVFTADDDFEAAWAEPLDAHTADNASPVPRSDAPSTKEEILADALAAENAADADVPVIRTAQHPSGDVPKPRVRRTREQIAADEAKAQSDRQLAKDEAEREAAKNAPPSESDDLV